MSFRCSAKIRFCACAIIIICSNTVCNQVVSTNANNFIKYRRGHLEVGQLFECLSGERIPEDKLCDGREDCDDGSDETRDCVNIIPCASKFLFQCDYGACINKNAACDGIKDCKDNSDESEAACLNCGRGKFLCNSGQCIDGSGICNGVAECNDRSDETASLCSENNCPSTTYRCKYGACVKRGARCDRISDCLDNSDEANCSGTGFESSTLPVTIQVPDLRPCSISEYQCNSGKCIHEDKLCDGKDDCGDVSDETVLLCTLIKCPSYTYRCKYGACVNANARCNGNKDCIDNSDEENCPSIPAPFIPTTEVLPSTWNTEQLDRNHCRSNQYKCNSGKCIDNYKTCNGYPDCADNSDETSRLCSRKMCTSNHYRCSYGACVEKAAHCNRTAECLDSSDETGCVESTTVINTINTDLPVISNSCELPKHPKGGRYSLVNSGNRGYKHGDSVPEYTTLIIHCEPGYKPIPPDTRASVCLDRNWSPLYQNCSKICPPFSVTSATCKFNDKALNSCENSVEDTVAIIPCLEQNAESGVSRHTIKICKDGAWFPSTSRCILGLSQPPQANSTIINIFVFNEKLKYPRGKVSSRQVRRVLNHVQFVWINVKIGVDNTEAQGAYGHINCHELRAKTYLTP